MPSRASWMVICLPTRIPDLAIICYPIQRKIVTNLANIIIAICLYLRACQQALVGLCPASHVCKHTIKNPI